MTSAKARRLIAGGLFAIALSMGLSQPRVEAGDPPDPVVSVTAPAQSLIGEHVTMTASFSNGSASMAGYGPYLDVRMPLGADGNDGLTFESATYLGANLTSTSLVADGGGCVTHPYALDAAGAHVRICGLAVGQSLVVIRLPFGSFTPGQPAALVAIRATLSALADAGTPLSVVASGGFQFGADPLDNPATDPSIAGSTTSATVTPTVIRVTKTYLGPENETATGPNFVHAYRLDASVAPGQTVTNLLLSDTLPNTLQFLSADATTPESTPFSLPATTSPGGTYSVRFASITGSGGTDASATFHFFVPRLDTSSAPVLDPATGAFAPSVDSASVTATWTPIDIRDVAGPVTAGPVAHTLTDRSVAIQKSVRLAVDDGPTGTSPGDALEWTMQVQVSDFFALGNLVVDDKLFDGTRFDPEFTPTVEVDGNAFTSGAADIDPSNLTVSAVDGAGITPISFRISDELATRGHDQKLVGGCIDPVGGSAAPDCALYDNGPTTVTVVFRSIVQQTYVDDRQVVEGDTLRNETAVTAQVLDTASFEPTGASIGDGSAAVASAGSSASIAIQRGTLSKSIYAVNGSTSFIQPLHVGAGDTVTYRLSQTFPTSRTDDFRITDYLPLPVFAATEVAAFDSDATGTAPAAGHAKYGPADTFHSIARAPTPSVTTSATANSIEFRYGDFAAYPPVASTADLLFTVTVSNSPFADGLLLTNQARSQTRNAAGTLQTADAIVQITLDQPVVSMTKGIVTTSKTSATFTPSMAGAADFTVPPSAACPSWTGTITSASLAAHPLTSDLSGVDAGDLVRFAITLQNTGHATAWDVRVADTLPAGLRIPDGGLDLCASTGAGTPVATANVGAGSGLFDQGIEIGDSTNGSVAGGDAATASGGNVVLVTYTLEVDDSVTPNTTSTNSGRLLRYASSSGAANHLASPIADSATVTISNASAAKTIVADSEPATSLPDVAIGEIVTYRVTVTIPEGVLPAAHLTDTLPAGLALVDCQPVAASADVTSDVAGGFGAPCAPGTVGGSNPLVSGQTVTFNLGNVTNANRDDIAADTITVTYRAVVLNVAGNTRSATLHNSAVLTWTGGGLSAVSATDIRVVEPGVTVSTSASPTTGADAGDTITYTVTVTNQSLTNYSTSFDVSLSSVIPSGSTYKASSLQQVSGVIATLSDSDVTKPAATWASLAKGATSVIRFAVTLDASTVPSSSGTSHRVTSTVTWTSLPGTVTTPQSTFSGVSTERTGNGADPGTPNNYTAQAQSDITTKAAFSTKTLVSTNEAFTTGANVVVGEIATYQIRLKIPEGTTPSATVVDTLLAGLTLVDCVSITPSSSDLTTDLPGGFAAACNAGTTGAFNPVVSGQTATFTLGTLTNANRTDGVDETLDIVLRAVPTNVAANTRGKALSNSAKLNWTGGSANSANVNVTVVEPKLTVGQTVDRASGDAGDTITYTVTIANPTDTNGADASDVTWTNSIPTGLTYVPASLRSTTGAAPLTLVDADPANLTATWTTFAHTSTVTLEYKATLDADVPSGASYTNTSTVTWTSLPGNVTTPQSTFSAVSTERTGNQADPGTTVNTYTANGPVTVTVTQPKPVKTLVSTSEPSTNNPYVAIGEIARFRIEATIPEGSTPNVRLVDELPAGLQFLDDGTATVAFIGNQAGLSSNTLGAGPQVPGTSGWTGTPTYVLPGPAITGGPFFDGTDPVFNLGDVTNADRDADAEYVVVEFNVLVENVMSNQDGTPLVDFADIVTGTTTQSDPVVLTVVEPAITFSKTVSTAPVDAGDSVQYHLTVTNTAGLQAPPAFDLRITDTLDSNLDLQSVLASCPWADNTVGNAVDVTIDSLDPGSSCTVTIDARVKSDAQAGKTIPNVANAVWTSLPGSNGTTSNATGSAVTGFAGMPTGERTNDGGAVNDYRASANASTTLAAPSIAKLGPSVASAPIGATTDFDLIVTVPEGATHGLTVVDTLPAGLAPVSATVIDEASLSGGRLADDFAGELGDATITAPSGSTGGVWSFAFGDTTNPVDADSTDDNFLIRVTARIANVSGNQANTSLVNAASVQYTNPDSGTATVNAPQTRSVSVVEPVVTITKSADISSPRFGDVVTYTVTVHNQAPSGAAAFGVAIADTLPSGLTLVGGSLQNTAGTVPTTLTETAGGISASFATLSLNGNSTLTFRARVGDSASVSLKQSIVNQVSATWTSLPGVDSNERTGADGAGGALNDYATSASATVTVSGVDLSITKTDSRATAVAGQQLVYTLGYSNAGNQSATGVTMTETVPANTTFTTTGSSAGWSCANGAIAGSSCTMTIGSVAASGSGSKSFAVNVVSPLPSGVTSIANTATIADDGSKNADPTAANNAATDTDTVNVADLSLTKTVDVPRPDANQQVTFTVTLHNAGPSAATNVTVSDALPAALTFVTATPASGSYNSTTGVWSVASIASNTSTTLTIRATAGTSSSSTNTAQVTRSDQSDPDSVPGNGVPSEDDIASASVTPLVADLAVTKTVDSDHPDVGSVVTYTITATNNGPDDATGAIVTETAPAGVAFESSNPSTGSFVVDSGASGTWTIGSLAAGSHATLTISGRITSPGTLTNSASISGSPFDPNMSNNGSSASVGQLVDVAIAKTVDVSTPNVGQNVAFGVTATNLGPSTAHGVVVTDLLPAGLAFVSATPSAGTYDSGTGTWTAGTIAANATATLDVVAHVDGPTPATNTATLAHVDEPQTTTANDSAAASVTPKQADLRVVKTVDVAQREIGDPVAFTIHLQNAGPDAATNVVVTDALPAGLTFVSAMPSAGSYDAIAGTWTIASVVNGGDQNLVIHAQVSIRGDIVNTASVTASDVYDPIPANNASSATVSTRVADVAVTKSVSDPAPTVGTTIEYTIDVANGGPDGATELAVTDRLPAGLAFVSATASTGTYDSTTGVWSIGLLDNGTSATLAIRARVTGSGSIANTAAVSDLLQRDPDPANDTSTASIVVPPAADLSLTKTVDVTHPVRGNQVVYTLSVANAGPDATAAVVVRDVLPAGLTFVSADAGSMTYDEATGDWMVGAVAANATTSMTITARVEGEGPVTNVAEITASSLPDPDSTPGNGSVAEDDRSSVTVDGLGIADLSLSTTVSAPSVPVGASLTYTLTLSNGGPDAASGIRVRDLLPAALTYASHSGGTYDAATGIWTIPSLPAGETVTLTITATVRTPGSIPNNAEVVSADQHDPDSVPANGAPNEDDQAGVGVTVPTPTPAPTASPVPTAARTATPGLTGDATSSGSRPHMTAPPTSAGSPDGSRGSELLVVFLVLGGFGVAALVVARSERRRLGRR